MTKKTDPDKEPKSEAPEATDAKDASDAKPVTDAPSKEQKAEDAKTDEAKADISDGLYEAAAIDPDPTGKDDEVPTAAVATAAQPSSSSGVMVVVIVLLVLGAVVGGAWATNPLWLPHLAAQMPMASPDPSLDPRLQGLEDKVAALETELKKVQSAPAGDNALADLQARRDAFQAEVGDMVSKVTDLENRLSAVRKMAEVTTLPSEAASAKAEVTQLSDRLQPLGTDTKALDELMQRISKLEAEGRALRQEANLDGRDIADVVRDLEGRLGSVEQRGSQGVENQAMILVIGQLRAALEGSQPYTNELQALKAVSPNDAAINKAIALLDSHAASGIKTLDDLIRDFRDATSAIIAADRKLEGGSWFRSTVNNLSSIVTVRKTDPNEAKGTDRIVAIAERQLKQGDLIGAVDTLAQLAGEPAAAAKPWLQAAQARVDAEQALATLHVHAVARLAPGDQTSGGKE